MNLYERRAFFDSYGRRTEERTADLPPGGIRFSCPCCGYPMLGERGGYEVCHLCWWEDDGQDDSDADEVRGGPNSRYSLVEARLNFETYLVMYTPEEDIRVGGPDSQDVLDLKRSLIAAFDAMTCEPSAGELNELWNDVKRCERALNGELKRSLREQLATLNGPNSGVQRSARVGVHHSSNPTSRAR